MSTSAITPGTYLRKRREAAGLTIADVAAQLATEPRIAEHARAEWLALIEADQMPASFNTIVALRCAFPFALDVLERLVGIALGADVPAPQICRKCACTEWDPCDGPCFWDEADLCSACVDPVSRVDSIHAIAGGAAA